MGKNSDPTTIKTFSRVVEAYNIGFVSISEYHTTLSCLVWSWQQWNSIQNTQSCVNIVRQLYTSDWAVKGSGMTMITNQDNVLCTSTAEKIIALQRESNSEDGHRAWAHAGSQDPMCAHTGCSEKCIDVHTEGTADKCFLVQSAIAVISKQTLSGRNRLQCYCLFLSCLLSFTIPMLASLILSCRDALRCC